jgi:putative endonuclease
MYILECADGSYYTGSTWNLEKRLWEHQNGQGANHTAKHLPVKLAYCEEGDSIEAAYRREKQIQGWSRKKKQAMMAGDSNQLHRLAACRNASHSCNVGFGSAQPTSQSASQSASQPTSQSASPSTSRSLSGAEGRDSGRNEGD